MYIVIAFLTDHEVHLLLSDGHPAPDDVHGDHQRSNRIQPPHFGVRARERRRHDGGHVADDVVAMVLGQRHRGARHLAQPIAHEEQPYFEGCRGDQDALRQRRHLQGGLSTPGEAVVEALRGQAHNVERERAHEDGADDDGHRLQAGLPRGEPLAGHGHVALREEEHQLVDEVHRGVHQGREDGVRVGEVPRGALHEEQQEVDRHGRLYRKADLPPVDGILLLSLLR
mmetsp:Transcript_10768/g.22433  ORF Transcript_10768/g.22433 Transcript_10768/m.22433 type:complete len:227 (-) Transcript_10768:384-1064(-)